MSEIDAKKTYGVGDEYDTTPMAVCGNCDNHFITAWYDLSDNKEEVEDYKEADGHVYYQCPECEWWNKTGEVT